MAGGARDTTVAVPGSVPSKKHRLAPPATTIGRIGSTHTTHGAGATLVHGFRPGPGMLDLAVLLNAADPAAEGLIEPPPHVQSVFGVERAPPARCGVPGSEVGGLPPGTARTAAEHGRPAAAAERARAPLGSRAAA